MQNSGRQVMMVTSGAVALGRQRVSNEIISKALKNNQERPSITKAFLDKNACAAAGQNSLMSLYTSLFAQYGISTAQVCVILENFVSAQND